MSFPKRWQRQQNCEGFFRSDGRSYERGIDQHSFGCLKLPRLMLRSDKIWSHIWRKFCLLRWRATTGPGSCFYKRSFFIKYSKKITGVWLVETLWGFVLFSFFGFQSIAFWCFQSSIFGIFVQFVVITGSTQLDIIPEETPQVHWVQDCREDWGLWPKPMILEKNKVPLHLFQKIMVMFWEWYFMTVSIVYHVRVLAKSWPRCQRLSSSSGLDSSEIQWFNPWCWQDSKIIYYTLENNRFMYRNVDVHIHICIHLHVDEITVDTIYIYICIFTYIFKRYRLKKTILDLLIQSTIEVKVLVFFCFTTTLEARGISPSNLEIPRPKRETFSAVFPGGDFLHHWDSVIFSPGRRIWLRGYCV